MVSSLGNKVNKTLNESEVYTITNNVNVNVNPKSFRLCEYEVKVMCPWIVQIIGACYEENTHHYISSRGQY